MRINRIKSLHGDRTPNTVAEVARVRRAIAEHARRIVREINAISQRRGFPRRQGAILGRVKMTSEMGSDVFRATWRAGRRS